MFKKEIAEDGKLEMPPCAALFIVGYLFEIGPVMGDSPITCGEIESWQRNTGIELNAWEARALKRLSAIYLSESHKATKPDYPAPWAEQGYAKVALSLSAQSLKNSMRALAEL